VEIFLKSDALYRELARSITLSFDSADLSGGESKPVLGADTPRVLKASGDAWKVPRYTKVTGYRDGQNGYRTLVSAPNGDPLVVDGPLGKGRLVLVLAKDLPWSWAAALFEGALNEGLKKGEQIIPYLHGWGTMAFTVLDDKAVAVPKWTRCEEIAGEPVQGDDSGESPPKETFNGALSVPFALKAGDERTVTFVLTWHFPNVTRFKHEGNFYARRWPDALTVARSWATEPHRRQ